MGLAGPIGPTKKREAELIGDLYLVGARGKFCAVITERQLTIERFDGKGVRLDLAAIERMRHLKIPMLPSGTVLLGLISIYLGFTTIFPPMNWVAIGLGALVIISNIMSRYSILAIETGSGDFFAPARKLFIKFGFKPSEPFAHYKIDPNSCYFSLNL